VSPGKESPHLTTGRSARGERDWAVSTRPGNGSTRKKICHTAQKKGAFSVTIRLQCGILTVVGEILCADDGFADMETAEEPGPSVGRLDDSEASRPCERLDSALHNKSCIDRSSASLPIPVRRWLFENHHHEHPPAKHNTPDRLELRSSSWMNHGRDRRRRATRVNRLAPRACVRSVTTLLARRVWKSSVRRVLPWTCPAASFPTPCLFPGGSAFLGRGCFPQTPRFGFTVLRFHFDGKAIR
jgi:hypothetical protein